MSSLKTIIEIVENQVSERGAGCLLMRDERILVHRLIESEAELIYLRKYGKDGAVWTANESKEVWRKMAREELSK